MDAKKGRRAKKGIARLTLDSVRRVKRTSFARGDSDKERVGE